MKDGFILSTFAQIFYNGGMSAIVTAIPLKQPLFERIQIVAREMELPQSDMIVLAVEQFLKQYEKQKVIDQLNAVYADDDQSDELELLNAYRGQVREMVENDQFDDLLNTIIERDRPLLDALAKA